VYVDAPEALKVWQVAESKGQSLKLKVGLPARAKISLAGILQQRLWWWMELAGLGALMLEMVVADLKRRPES